MTTPFARLRLGRLAVLLVSLAVVTLASAGVHTQAPPTAVSLLAMARAALGGDAALDGVHSFVASASVDDRFSSRTLEVDWVRPDKFLVITTRTAGPQWATQQLATYDGFNGGRLIYLQEMPRDMPGDTAILVRAAPAPTAATEAARVRQELIWNRLRLAELAVALFAASPDAYPVAFAVTGREALPTGPADRLEVTTPDGPMLLLLDATTHLPVRMTWPVPIASDGLMTTTAQSSSLKRPPDASTTPLRDPATGDRILNNDARLAPPSEVTRSLHVIRETGTPGQVYVDLSDYRVTRGVRWPHRFTTILSGEVIDTLKVGSFALNAKIKDSLFAPPK